MALPAVAVGAAVGAAPLLVYGAKAVYDSIVEDDDPDSTFSLFAQPPTMNMPGKDAKSADPLTAADEQYMVDKLFGAPTRPYTQSPSAPIEASDPEVAPYYQDDTSPDPEEDLTPLMEGAAPSGAPSSAPPIIPDGDWKYQVLPRGVVKIVAGPPGSKAVGMTLDPARLAVMPEGPSKARLMRAYESIKSVSQGGQPLPRHSAPKKPAPPAPAVAPTPPTSEPAAAPAPSPVQAAAPAQAAPDRRPFGGVRRMFSRFYEPGAGASGDGAY